MVLPSMHPPPEFSSEMGGDHLDRVVPVFAADQEVGIQGEDAQVIVYFRMRTRQASARDIGLSRYFTSRVQTGCI